MKKERLRDNLAAVKETREGRIREVILAVQETPAEKLASGTPITGSGCLCAIGAWAYCHDPKIKRTVDSLRKRLDYRVAENAADRAYKAFRKDLQDFPTLITEIYAANDTAYHFSDYIHPEECKAAILASLQKLVA